MIKVQLTFHNTGLVFGFNLPPAWGGGGWKADDVNKKVTRDDSGTLDVDDDDDRLDDKCRE
jgi:hypothetical protein